MERKKNTTSSNLGQVHPTYTFKFPNLLTWGDLKNAFNEYKEGVIEKRPNKEV